ncbi:Uncharacterised protein [Vibrio cholerae]|nr:hypothetical protein DN32_2127 [Vibrio cholerae]CSD71944.1 Uncharacterised protein [Vibrio cholerae]
MQLFLSWYQNSEIEKPALSTLKPKVVKNDSWHA